MKGLRESLLSVLDYINILIISLNLVYGDGLECPSYYMKFGQALLSPWSF